MNKVICITILLVAPLTAVSQVTTTSQARRALRIMKDSGQSLAQIIARAEQECGGEAVGVRVASPAETDYQLRQKEGDGPEPKACYVVTCLTDGSRLRDVYVCAESATVLGLRGSGSGYGGDWNNGHGTRVDPRYIEQNAWPPSRGDRYYDSYVDARNSDDSGRVPNSRNSSDRWSNVGCRQFVRASELMNANAVGYGETELGRIDDLALDFGSQRVLYAVLTYGGFLGIGQKNVAIPCDALGRMRGDSIGLSISKSELRSRPGFEDSKWPAQPDPWWRGQTNATSAPVVQVNKASKIIGREMLGADDKSLGEVEDLIIDVNHERLCYLLVGQNRNFVAVPAAAVTLNKSGKPTISLTREQFSEQPAFRDGFEPDWSDSYWAQRVHRAFNVAWSYQLGDQPTRAIPDPNSNLTPRQPVSPE